MITPAKLGWMAAIIDMRGRVYAKNNKDRATRQIVLMVESRYPKIINELAALTGTRPEFKTARPLKDFMRRGCREHCNEAHVHVNDERIMPMVQRWTITGAGMAIVTDALQPYLVEQDFTAYRDEIMNGLDVGGRGSDRIRSTINRLVSLGWPLPGPIEERLERRQREMATWREESDEGDGSAAAELPGAAGLLSGTSDRAN